MLTEKRILIADDNKLNQKILVFVLEKNGAKVSVASNGKEVIELVNNQDFDAILMDLQMPVMDGFEASVQIKHVLMKAVPIIGLTANAFERDNAACLDAGMVMCISKPFEPAELCAIIKNTIENS